MCRYLIYRTNPKISDRFEANKVAVAIVSAKSIDDAFDVYKRFLQNNIEYISEFYDDSADIFAVPFNSCSTNDLMELVNLDCIRRN